MRFLLNTIIVLVCSVNVSCESNDEKQEIDLAEVKINKIEKIKHKQAFFYYPYFSAQTTSNPIELLNRTGKIVSINFSDKSSKNILNDFARLKNEGKFMNHAQSSSIFVGGYILLDTGKKINNEDAKLTYQFIMKDFFLIEKNGITVTKFDLDKGYDFLRDQKLIKLDLISKKDATPKRLIESKDYIESVKSWKEKYVRKIKE